MPWYPDDLSIYRQSESMSYVFLKETKKSYCWAGACSAFFSDAAGVSAFFSGAG